VGVDRRCGAAGSGRRTRSPPGDRVERQVDPGEHAATASFDANRRHDDGAARHQLNRTDHDCGFHPAHDDPGDDRLAAPDTAADAPAHSATDATPDTASSAHDYAHNQHHSGHDLPTTPTAAVISIVIPLHNEERSVALLYDELQSALEPLGEDWEAVFVDDGSVDGSFAALTRLHSARDNVRVVRLRRNFGKAAALATGFGQAQGETVVTIDADLQDDPAEIPRLLAKLDEGFDLVSGWKTRRRDPLRRRMLSKVFNWVTGRLSGLRLHDMNCGLKAYRAEVVHGLRLYGELHRFIPVLAHYRGFRIAELPVNHRPREHGRSRYGVERYVRGFLDLLTVSFIGRYRHRPLHLFGGLGLVLGAIGLAILVYLTVVKALGHAIGERPLLTLGVLLVVVGLQFFSLGLISEMLTSQHEESAGGREQAELHVDEILS
jgi:glycosyltransferase involved in cell wall biosynthesis